MRDIEGRRQGHIEKEGKQRREKVETEGRETEDISSNAGRFLLSPE